MIKLDIFKVNDTEQKRKYWEIFKNHHYLTDEFSMPAQMFVAYWGDRLVAMTSFLVFPNGSVRNYIQTHRLIVLPDFQGMGIGLKLETFVANYLMKYQGKKPYIKSTHYKIKDYMQNKGEEKGWDFKGIVFRSWSEEFAKYENDLPKGVDPTTYGKPFKVYDFATYKGEPKSKTGKGSYHWVNRECVSAEYVGVDYFTKPRILIIMEPRITKNNRDRYCEIFDKFWSENKYTEVINGTTENGTEDELFTNEYQYRSCALYDKKGIRQKVWNWNFWDYDEIVYIYNKKNHKLKKFIEDLEDIGTLFEIEL